MNSLIKAAIQRRANMWRVMYNANSHVCLISRRRYVSAYLTWRRLALEPLLFATCNKLLLLAIYS